MIARYTCNHCFYYSGAFACRRHAPPWPTVSGTDWCGEFERDMSIQPMPPSAPRDYAPDSNKTLPPKCPKCGATGSDLISGADMGNSYFCTACKTEWF